MTTNIIERRELDLLNEISRLSQLLYEKERLVKSQDELLKVYRAYLDNLHKPSKIKQLLLNIKNKCKKCIVQK